jgi:hypothetical protein
MPDPAPANPPPTRSQTLFSQAAPEVKALVKLIMERERSVQYIKPRPAIYETILQYVKESQQ